VPELRLYERLLLMDADKGRMTEMDRWVFSVLALVAVALIVASALTSDTIYLTYLGGPAILAGIYFFFIR
jgi:hypothetical protein